MINSIFYSCLFLLSLVKLLYLSKSNTMFKMVEVVFRYYKITKKYSIVEFKKYLPSFNQKILSSYGYLIIFSLIFKLVGLLSGSWILFLANLSLLLFFRILIYLITKVELLKFGKIHYFIYLISFILDIVTELLIVINYFHLKINLYDYITT